MNSLLNNVQLFDLFHHDVHRCLYRNVYHSFSTPFCCQRSMLQHSNQERIFSNATTISVLNVAVLQSTGRTSSYESNKPKINLLNYAIPNYFCAFILDDPTHLKNFRFIINSLLTNLITPSI